MALLRSASQFRRGLQHERVNPISHPGLGHLLVSFSFGILSPSPIIASTGGHPAQGGTKLRNGLRASCYSRLRGGKLGPLGRHFVARL